MQRIRKGMFARLFRDGSRQLTWCSQLGLMGMTALWSSGDYGVAALGGQCLNSTGDLGTGSGYSIFGPSFPATCPYVTSVGATEINVSSVRLVIG